MRRRTVYTHAMRFLTWLLAAVTLGAAVPDFTLKTPSGEAVSFAEHRKGKDGAAAPAVVTFWSYECPTGAGSMERFAELAANAEKRGAKFIAVCSYGESVDEIAAYARKHGIAYTLLVDEACKVADIFGAGPVTATYVVDKDGKLAYKGGLGESKKPWPEQALDELQAGKPVSRPETRAHG